eukprot:6652443-Heterocapsa_arctica.AAC.1
MLKLQTHGFKKAPRSGSNDKNCILSRGPAVPPPPRTRKGCESPEVNLLRLRLSVIRLRRFVNCLRNV